MDYSVIAPAYNEEGNVAPLIEKITGAMSGVTEAYEIIIVDDGSTDGTLEKLQALREEHRNLAIISLAENSGQTVGMQAGFDYAKGERIVTMDSDLEKDPKFIPVMIDKMESESLDAVYFKKIYQDVPWKRRIASDLANRFRRAVTGDKAADVGSTYILFRRNVFKGRNFGSGFHRYFIGFMEVEGLKMDCVQGPVYLRPSGETKYTNFGRLKQGLADMFYYYLYKNKRTSLVKTVFLLFGIGAMFYLLSLPAQTAVISFVGLILTTILALTLHVVHLLVQGRRLPYAVKGYWPSLNSLDGS